VTPAAAATGSSVYSLSLEPLPAAALRGRRARSVFTVAGVPVVDGSYEYDVFPEKVWRHRLRPPEGSPRLLPGRDNWIWGEVRPFKGERRRFEGWADIPERASEDLEDEERWSGAVLSPHSAFWLLEEGPDPLDADGEWLGPDTVLPLEELVPADPEEEADLRLDYELRRAARPLHELTSKVITETAGHPFTTLTCENCGDQPARLVWCGVPICFPCWRKQGGRAFGEIVRVSQVWVKRHREAATRGGVPMGLRLVTLTIRNGPVLEERMGVLLESFDRLRARAFWKNRVVGDCSRVEVTWNPLTGWHSHLHVLAGGRYLPSSPPGFFETPHMVRRPRPKRRSTPGEPAFLREYEPESNLRDEWREATRGEGEIVDVREADLRADPTGFARELTKYLTKPFASTAEGAHIELAEWPEDVRLELARWLRGGERVRWYCPEHRTANRRLCPDGCPEGEYRREAVGARRLRWHGELRTIHAELEEALEEEEPTEERCGHCGKGRLLTEREVAARLAEGWNLPRGAVWPLPSILAHRSRTDPAPASAFDGSPVESWSGCGSEGPPAATPGGLEARETTAAGPHRERELGP
jgi:hypothetical protein